MQHTMLVREFNRPCHLNHQFSHTLFLFSLDCCIRSLVDCDAAQALRQAHTLDQLHAEEVLGLEFPDFIDRDDARMMQPRRRFRLYTKSL